MLNIGSHADSRDEAASSLASFNRRRGWERDLRQTLLLWTYAIVGSVTLQVALNGVNRSLDMNVGLVSTWAHQDGPCPGPAGWSGVGSATWTEAIAVQRWGVLTST